MLRAGWKKQRESSAALLSPPMLACTLRGGNIGKAASSGPRKSICVVGHNPSSFMSTAEEISHEIRRTFVEIGNAIDVLALVELRVEHEEVLAMKFPIDRGATHSNVVRPD